MSFLRFLKLVLLVVAVTCVAACQYGEREGNGTIEVVAKTSSALGGPATITLTATSVPDGAVRTEKLSANGAGWSGILSHLPWGMWTFAASVFIPGDVSNDFHSASYEGHETVTISSAQPAHLTLVLQNRNPASPFANSQPTIRALYVSSTRVLAGDYVELMFDAYDSDLGQTLSYVWSDDGVAFDPTTGTTAFTNGQSAARTSWHSSMTPGSHHLVGTVIDSGFTYSSASPLTLIPQGGAASVSVDIEVVESLGAVVDVTASVNFSPTITSMTLGKKDPFTGHQDVSALATDPDGDDVHYAWTSENGCASVNSNPPPTYEYDETPEVSFSGNCSLIVTVTDSHGGSSKGVLTIHPTAADVSSTDNCNDPNHPNPCGHGTCASDSEGVKCTCDSGYEGPRCETDVDDCLGNTQCANGSMCVNHDGTPFTCDCQLGFEGAHCEMDIVDCTPDSCNGHGQCFDQLNGVSCECDAGYDLPYCAIDHDDCEYGPCQNGGHCTDAVAGYTCECAIGFEGANCDQSILDPCLYAPCGIQGTCYRTGNETFTCQCPTGYEGDHCATNIDDCAGNPCASGRTCVDDVGYYTCQCPEGYGGEHCETNFDLCNPNPCQHAFLCQSAYPGFTCYCDDGYEGPTCATPHDYCANGGDTCQNGGVCFSANHQANCNCSATGHTGQFCQDVDHCVDNACVNGGVCANGPYGYTCQCSGGYGGQFCDQDE